MANKKWYQPSFWSPDSATQGASHSPSTEHAGSGVSNSDMLAQVQAQSTPTSEQGPDTLVDESFDDLMEGMMDLTRNPDQYWPTYPGTQVGPNSILYNPGVMPEIKPADQEAADAHFEEVMSGMAELSQGPGVSNSDMFARLGEAGGLAKDDSFSLGLEHRYVDGRDTWADLDSHLEWAQDEPFFHPKKKNTFGGLFRNCILLTRGIDSPPCTHPPTSRHRRRVRLRPRVAAATTRARAVARSACCAARTTGGPTRPL